jgi:gliding motility-associated lipoprotein GldH
MAMFFSLESCIKSNTYEKNVSLPSHKWAHKLKPSFEFEISDTNSNYLVYFTIRHTDAYPFSNIWLNVYTTMPGGTQSPPMRTEVPLAQEDGKWLGKTFNEICTQQLLLTKDGAVHFDKKGKYTIKLEQIMRQDPLPEIMSVGLRLEKVLK